MKCWVAAKPFQPVSVSWNAEGSPPPCRLSSSGEGPVSPGGTRGRYGRAPTIRVTVPSVGSIEQAVSAPDAAASGADITETSGSIPATNASATPIELRLMARADISVPSLPHPTGVTRNHVDLHADCQPYDVTRYTERATPPI